MLGDPFRSTEHFAAMKEIEKRPNDGSGREEVPDNQFGYVLMVSDLSV